MTKSLLTYAAGRGQPSGRLPRQWPWRWANSGRPEGHRGSCGSWGGWSAGRSGPECPRPTRTQLEIKCKMNVQSKKSNAKCPIPERSE
jgi:hypothetical protein